MIILHIAPIDTSIANGLRFSVPGLASAQNKFKGINAGLWNIEDEKNTSNDETKRYDFDFYPECKSIKELPMPYNKPDIVVFHGVYFGKYIRIYKQLIKDSIPYIIVPRVSLTFEAQKQKRIKKKIANLVMFNKFIKNAVKIHYLTMNECQLSNSFQTDNFVVGNGIDIPPTYRKSKSDRINITFIGRYDINHKGLDILLESINQVKEELLACNAKISLFGTDFREGKAFLKSKIKKYGLEKICYVNQPVYNEKKQEVLENTNLFVAPSRFEGHPMAVIEAMANGIPCILTPGTNMVDVLEQYNAGWTAELEPKKFARVIIDAIKDNNELNKRGENARLLVEENYSWERIAKETLSHYRSVQNR